MSIARGWGKDGKIHRLEDELKKETLILWRKELRHKYRKNKIRRIFNVNR